MLPACIATGLLSWLGAVEGFCAVPSRQCIGSGHLFAGAIASAISCCCRGDSDLGDSSCQLWLQEMRLMPTGCLKQGPCSCFRVWCILPWGQMSNKPSQWSCCHSHQRMGGVSIAPSSSCWQALRARCSMSCGLLEVSWGGVLLQHTAS